MIVWLCVGLGCLVVGEAAVIGWLVFRVKRWDKVIRVTPVDAETRRMRYQQRLGTIIESAGR